MNLELSNTTATLLKEQLTGEPLSWITENKLDLASIKKLKGCRVQLLKDCLKFIAQLDSFSGDNEGKKAFSTGSTLHLIEILKKYINSSKHNPRLKKFLNFIPDHTGSIVGFALIVSSALSIVSPPFAVIPIVIFFWILMDLSFNNREVAKNLQDALYSIKAELRTIEEADTILKVKVQATLSTVQTVSSTSPIPRPGPSTSRDYAARSYDSIKNDSKTEVEIHDHQSTGLTLT